MLYQQSRKKWNWILPLPFVKEFIGHVGRVIVGAVPSHAVGPALDERRSLPTVRPLDRFFCAGIYRQNVVAIHRLNRHSVPQGSLSHAGYCHLLGQRRRIGVLIVDTKVDHGQSHYRRDVQSFVPITAAAGAISRIAENYVLPTAYLERQRHPGCHGYGIRHVANKCADAQLPVPHVHVAVATTHRPVSSTEVLEKHRLRRHSFEKEGA